MRYNNEFKIMRLRDLPVDMPVMDTAQSVFDYWSANIVPAQWYNPDVECLCIIHVNTRRRPIGFNLISTGTLDTILVHPREVFRPAIIIAAAAIVLAHNHPGGDPSPSDGDINVTLNLIRAGQLLKIDVLDHVIIGRKSSLCEHGYVSLREMGHFLN